MTYSIQNVDNLENSAQELENSNSKVINDAESLQYILNQILSNWENEEGLDRKGIEEEFVGCINNLKEAITPTITKYVKTMNTLVGETRTIQKRSVETGGGN